MTPRGRSVAVVAWAAVAVFFTGCDRAQTKAPAPAAPRIMPVPAAERPQSPPAGSGATGLASHLKVSAPPFQPTVAPKPDSPAPKVVASDRNQTLTVAQQTFRLLTRVQTIEGTGDETVEWWELRDGKDHVVYRQSYPLAFENGLFESTIAISGSSFTTSQGGGILIHGFDLPSAPDSGGWVQLFGFRYGRDKYGADESLFGPFGPPISVEGEFLGAATDSSRPGPTMVGGATLTVMRDVLRFRLWTGNFHIVYPVLINWITGSLQPGWRCPEMTSKGPVDRCTYSVSVEESHRENQPTFVRLFPEPDDGYTPKHVIVQPVSKIEFLEARMPVTWNQDDKAISFNVRGDIWLKIRIDGVEGWIHSEEDFDAVGLPQAG